MKKDKNGAITRKNTNQVNFRFSDETIKELNELSSLAHTDKTKYLSILIHKDYLSTSKIGQDTIKQMNDAFKNLQNIMEDSLKQIEKTNNHK